MLWNVRFYVLTEIHKNHINFILYKLYSISMTIIAFDTYSFIKQLTAAGMPEAQAEIIANQQKELIEEKLATKHDIMQIKRDIVESEQRTIIKLGGMIIALGAFLAAIKFFA